MIGGISLGKKTKVLILTILILLSSVNIVNAVSITGNPKVDWLVEHGYVTGDSRGFRLSDKITRAETTKMVVEASGLGEYVDSFKYLASNFKDVNKKVFRSELSFQTGKPAVMIIPLCIR